MKNLFSSLAVNAAPVSYLSLLALWLACSAAFAQTPAASPATTTPSGVDESKIPEWVKKQADNPVKWIIQQDNKPKPRAAASEEKAAPKKTATKKPARPEEEAVVATPAAPPTVKLSPPTAAPVVANTAAPAPAAAKPSNEPAAAPPAAAPVVEAPAPAVAALAPPPEPNAAPPQLIEELVAINQPQPQLTREVLQSGIRNGRVTVSFTVNTDGSVTDAAVTQTSDRQLNRSVLNAVKQWVYKPISKSQTKSVEIAFQLE